VVDFSVRLVCEIVVAGAGGINAHFKKGSLMPLKSYGRCGIRAKTGAHFHDAQGARPGVAIV